MVKKVFITPQSTDIIAYGARFSTATQCESVEEQMELNSDNKRLVRKLIDKGHYSCLEFADAMFEINGSRNLTHQIVRHRHFSICQQSFRYSKSGGKFVIPPEVIDMGLGENLNIIYGHMQEIYEDLIGKGVKKEDARFVLPNGVETSLVMKGNFRSWIEFLNLRTDKKAQWEIREVAEDIKKILIEESYVFKYFYNRGEL